MKPTIFEVYDEFSKAIGVPCALAGGAVRDFLLGREPRDYDIFAFEPFDPRRLIAKYDIVRERNAYTFDVTTMLWRGAEVQVITHLPHRSNPHELIASFDWNITQFCWDGRKILQGMPAKEMQPGGTLRLIRNEHLYDKNPRYTLRRGFRFSERYDLRMTYADQRLLYELCIGSIDLMANAELMAA